MKCDITFWVIIDILVETCLQAIIPEKSISTGGFLYLGAGVSFQPSLVKRFLRLFFSLTIFHIFKYIIDDGDDIKSIAILKRRYYELSTKYLMLEKFITSMAKK